MGMPLALLANVANHMLTQSAFDASLQHHPFHVRGLSPYKRDHLQPPMEHVWFEPSKIKGKTINLLIKNNKN